MGLRDEIRAATVGKTPTFASRPFTLPSGQTIEVREPTHAEHARMRRAATVTIEEMGPQGRVEKSYVDSARFRALSVLLCCYEPGTNARIFEEGDLDALLGQPTSGWFWDVAQVANELILTGGQAGKVSPATASGTSSSASPSASESSPTR